MDIEQQASTSRQTQTLRCLIKQILQTNTAYDCMPMNNSVSSISKESPIYDAINIIINENIQELLVWDETLTRWIWMITVADAIRLILHSLKTIIREGKVDFRLFQKYREEGLLTLDAVYNQKFSKEQVYLMLETFQKKKISDIILQINDYSPRLTHHESLHTAAQPQSSKEEAHSPLYSSKNIPMPPSTHRPYIRLKSVVKQTKLAFVIMTMIVQKINRILIQDAESNMIISILSFKDILLYLVRIANESQTSFYSTVPIYSLLQTIDIKHIQIQQNRPLWEAFQIMNEVNYSPWINVIDAQGTFKGVLFRQDFRNIFKGWHIDYLWMNAGDFVNLKQTSKTSIIPQYRFFGPNQVVKEIIWKTVNTKGNTIVWTDQNQGSKVKATLGLMELFSLFVR